MRLDYLESYDSYAPGMGPDHVLQRLRTVAPPSQNLRGSLRHITTRNQEFLIRIDGSSLCRWTKVRFESRGLKFRLRLLASPEQRQTEIDQIISCVADAALCLVPRSPPIRHYGFYYNAKSGKTPYQRLQWVFSLLAENYPAWHDFIYHTGHTLQLCCGTEVSEVFFGKKNFKVLFANNPICTAATLYFDEEEFYVVLTGNLAEEASLSHELSAFMVDAVRIYFSRAYFNISAPNNEVKQRMPVLPVKQLLC